MQTLVAAQLFVEIAISLFRFRETGEAHDRSFHDNSITWLALIPRQFSVLEMSGRDENALAGRGTLG
ncbi:MAG TPA: hypothetical protein VF626_00120 [Chthoniobacterales bacterium]